MLHHRCAANVPMPTILQWTQVAMYAILLLVVLDWDAACAVIANFFMTLHVTATVLFDLEQVFYMTPAPMVANAAIRLHATTGSMKVVLIVSAAMVSEASFVPYATGDWIQMTIPPLTSVQNVKEADI